MSSTEGPVEDSSTVPIVVKAPKKEVPTVAPKNEASAKQHDAKTTTQKNVRGLSKETTNAPNKEAEMSVKLGRTNAIAVSENLHRINNDYRVLWEYIVYI